MASYFTGRNGDNINNNNNNNKKKKRRYDDDDAMLMMVQVLYNNSIKYNNNSSVYSVKMKEQDWQFQTVQLRRSGEHLIHRWLEEEANQDIFKICSHNVSLTYI